MRPPLVEVADSPEGLLEIKVRDSWGVRIGFFQVRADDLDPEIIEALKAWQARHTHCGISRSPTEALTSRSVPPAGLLLRSESSPA